MSLYDDASLVMIPSGYKDGKLYSVKPSDGAGDFTFTRGSNLAATRVDENGLIEKGRENLLTQSNNFSDSDWTKYGGVTLSPNQADKDGGTDAWLLTKPAAGFTGIGEAKTITGVITFSVFAKANTHSKITIRLIGTPDVNVTFNLSNGTIFGGTSLNWIDRKIESVGDGWYKCSLTLNNSGSTNTVIYPDEITNTTAGSIYIQDAQLEVGLVATDYIETGATTAQAGILEDMPRLDYSGGTCPALLLEPQRTNQIIQSEYFGASTWLKRTSDGTAVPVVTDNYAVSPEGVQNAARVVITKPSGDSQYAIINENKVFVKSAGDKFSASVYLKATDASQVGKIVDLYAYDDAYLTMVNHTLTADWEKVEAIHTATTGTSNVEMIVIGKARASAGGTGLSDMATDFLVYGATFEVGSYPTSYIPTYGTSVTRGADACSKTGISSLIGQTEGTLYAEAKIEGLKNSNTIVTVHNGSFSEYLVISGNNSGNINAYIYAGGVQQAGILSGTYAVDSVVKCALAYKENDVAFYINGVLIGTDSSVTMASTSVFDVGSISFGNYPLHGTIKQAVLFNERLSNTELATLTTL